MRTSREPRPFKTEGDGVKDEVRCSECGRRLMTLKDHIQKEDAIVCVSCYHSAVFGYRAVGKEVFE